MLLVEAIYKKITLCGKSNDRGNYKVLLIIKDLCEVRHLLQHKVVRRGLLEEEITEINLQSGGCRATGVSKTKEGM